MLFVLWNVAHYSIIAVAFIRNGFIFIYYIVFIYSNDARACPSYLARARDRFRLCRCPVCPCRPPK